VSENNEQLITAYHSMCCEEMTDWAFWRRC